MDLQLQVNKDMIIKAHQSIVCQLPIAIDNCISHLPDFNFCVYEILFLIAI